MIADPRGPYARIRWFCNDGTVQAPTAYACSQRGGGRQHGEYSAARERLAALGFRVGTVFAALAYEDLVDGANRHGRLRELALERYLRDIDDGWVMRRARDYRGHIQVEGEMRSGRELLGRLYQDGPWIVANYLLAREAGRLLPHGKESDLMRSVRRHSQDLAAQVPATERLRVEVHTAPSVDTAAKYRRWAVGAAAPEQAAALQLADELDALFGPAGRRDRVSAALAEVARLVNETAHVVAMRTSVASALNSVDRSRVAGLSSAMLSCRALIEASATPASARIAAFDLLTELEAELLVSSQGVVGDVPRRDLVDEATIYLDAAFAVGLLSPGEHAVLRDARQRLEVDGSVPAYRRFVGQLSRVPQWSAGTVRFTFAEPLVRYTALNARAARFVDDVLRASPLVPLGSITRRLSHDLHQLTGVGVDLFGHRPVGVLALNAGFATGRLMIYATADALAVNPPERGDIAVIPETTAELVPVAGIITLGEGNPLSHVQLLARNFGIPNVAVAEDALALLQTHAGQTVTLAVSRAGSVVLAAEASALAAAGTLLRERAPADRASLTVPVPDLSVRRPLGLGELNKSLSGRVVGPQGCQSGGTQSVVSRTCRTRHCAAFRRFCGAHHCRSRAVASRLPGGQTRRAG